LVARRAVFCGYQQQIGRSLPVKSCTVLKSTFEQWLCVVSAWLNN
jgi:hypothetical protein